MDKMTKNKWQVRAVALVIFLLGAAAGALAMNAYHSWSRANLRQTRHDRFEQMLDRLQLTGEQEDQVRRTLADAREQLRAAQRDSKPRIDEIRRQTDERLRQVLTPTQWEQFQQMMAERRGRGRRGRGERSGPSQE